MKLIYAAAAISDCQEDGITSPNSDKAVANSRLADKWDTASKEELNANCQKQVFGDYVELPQGRKALTRHWLYMIKHDGASNVQRFKTRQACNGNHQIESIE
jgi:hypothetical protein